MAKSPNRTAAPRPLPLRQAVFTAAAAALLLALPAGCFSHRAPDELARAVAGGERPVAMLGAAPFFDGSITATVTISRGIGKGFHGTQGGHITDVGHGTRPDRNGLQTAELPDLENMDEDEAQDYARAKVAVGSPLPPVTLRLHLRNTSPAACSVEPIDFNSDLGDFVVTPDLVSIPAGAEASADPMISQLGVSSDDIPVTVTLRRGKQKETHIIHVRSLLATPPPPAS